MELMNENAHMGWCGEIFRLSGQVGYNMLEVAQTLRARFPPAFARSARGSVAFIALVSYMYIIRGYEILINI